MDASDAWRSLNRAHWDELVAVHLAGGYDLTPLREGRAMLLPIERSEIGPLAGLRIAHLQCHFGRDSLTLAQCGAAVVVGLDFSAPAIAVARQLAVDLRLDDRVRFVEADLYDASAAIGEPAAFDRVYVTWGAINWLPDIRGWAQIVAGLLKPGGALYLAEGHPSALVFDDRAQVSTRLPSFSIPYFSRAPLIEDDPRDYANDTAVLTNVRTWSWLYPLADIVNAILEAGLNLCWLHEHDTVPWRMFDALVPAPDKMYRWPDQAWLPLAFSLEARRPL